MTTPEVRIVHRDAALLVLDKPSGLPTTAPPGGGTALTDIAARLDPRAPSLHPSSRLDAEVTGLVTFTRTREANRALLEARARGSYGRTYLALSAGAPDPEEGEWLSSIGIDPRDKRKRIVVSRGGKAAKTRYETLFGTSLVALLALHPHTGRTHQLRVHAAHAGIPLFGDVHYGGPRRIVLPDGLVVTARRVMLHMRRLSLPDVARGGSASLELASEIPDDFRRAFAGLGGDPEAL